MDKNAIKKYAVWARNELIARVTQKAEQYEITEKKTIPADADNIRGKVLTATEKKQRQALIAKINTDGFGQVVEEVAYTWFNRFTALRFMEVNNYLPSHTRVFTNEAGEFKPQILADAIQLDLDGLDMDKVYELKDANRTEELYKYLLITQCNALSTVLPRMFQKIEDYTELLLPDYLLREGSVIEQMISMIPEDNFDVNSEGGQIEIIGWLYQYYVSEKHEEVVDPLHGKVVKKEEIPAATQLFTTDWVVRYLIDNSIGRYWVERNPNSNLSEQLAFFVKPKDEDLKTINEKITPQDVTIFDPCVGSGHFLIYAFDVLMKIYEEYGYSEREAAAEIVKRNIYGLDIDGRAAQLAYFSVMMKARQYDRRFFTRGIQPNVYEIVESNNVDKLSIEHFYENNSALKKSIEELLDIFIDAKEYGSILNIPDIDFEKINDRFVEINDEISMYNSYLLDDFRMLIRPAELLSGKYAVVATNPPYLNKYDPKLKDFIIKNYSEYKGDLFSVFMVRNYDFCIKGGFTAFMTPLVWMFIKTYEALRNLINLRKHIVSLIQFEYSAFEEATVPICSFITKNGKSDDKGLYFRLSDFRGGMDIQKDKVLEALADKSCGWFFEADQDNFCKIPGSPIAYWWGSHVFDLFEGKLLSDYAQPKVGLQTGKNDKYLRFWNEISWNDIGFDCKDSDEARKTLKRWFPCNKGGEFRRWYGNNNLVVDWEEDGIRIKNQKGSYIRNPQFYFKKGMTWSTISSGKLSMRYSPEGFLFETKGSVCFPNDETYFYYLLGLLNSGVAQLLLGALSPTLDYHEGPLGRIPVVIGNREQIEEISELVKENVEIAKIDWDSFEWSWDFSTHPLIAQFTFVGEEALIEDLFQKWQVIAEERFKKVKDNEERINQIFIDIYGLDHELSANVDDRDVSIRRADLSRDIKSLISYSVGCMFGRYSININGLAFAGGDWNSTKETYKSFLPDEDNVIPICDDEYFDDDIVARFVDFIRTVFGKKNLEANLEFIASVLGGKTTAREAIRQYFVNDFYKDHCNDYSVTGAGKRPIYWLFDSGRKNGFKCLIYMHRYQPDTIARIRTDYVHEQQSRYRTAITDLEQRINGAGTSERVKLNKQLQKLQDQASETRAYEEKIHHLADQMITIDLDDGVKVNYAKFQDVLAKIK